MRRHRWLWACVIVVSIPLLDFLFAYRWLITPVSPDEPLPLEIRRQRIPLQFPDARRMKEQLRSGTATIVAEREGIWPVLVMSLRDGQMNPEFGTPIGTSGDAEPEFEFADKYGVIPMLEKYDRDWRVTELNSVSLDPGGPFSGSVILVDFGIVSIMVRYIRLEVRNGKVISFRRIWDFMS